MNCRLWMLPHIYELPIASSPGPFQFFNVTCWKTGGPGTRLHVLDVTNASKIINMGVVNRNALLKILSWLRWLALSSMAFNEEATAVWHGFALNDSWKLDGVVRQLFNTAEARRSICIRKPWHNRWESNPHLHNSGVMLYQLNYQAPGSKVVGRDDSISSQGWLIREALLL